jgi:hypothetical protein
MTHSRDHTHTRTRTLNRRLPCSGTTSRWVRRATSPCSTTTGNATLDSALSAAVVGVLRNASTNPLARDISVSDATCNYPAALGASVTMDGECWTHVHEDEMSVFDFTYWSRVHPGGPVAITQFAVNGNN